MLINIRVEPPAMKKSMSCKNKGVTVINRSKQIVTIEMERTFSSSDYVFKLRFMLAFSDLYS